MIFSRQRLHGSAVVTGAGSGLGRAIALELAAAGWRLALVDLPVESGSRLTEVLAAVQACGGSGLVAAFDVRDDKSWQNLHDRLRAEWPLLEMLVNCAGVGATGEVGSLPIEQWRRVIDTNLIGTALGCEVFLPWLRLHPLRSHIINIASISGVVGLPSLAAYSASKAGVIALSESIAAECNRRCPGVTVVCPGFFQSGLLETWHFSAAIQTREARRRMQSTRWSSQSIAKRVLRCANSNRRYVVLGLRARWLWRLKRLAPQFTTALIRTIYRRLSDG